MLAFSERSKRTSTARGLNVVNQNVKEILIIFLFIRNFSSWINKNENFLQQ